LVYIDKCQYGLAGLDILEFLYVDFTYISVEGGYKAGIFQFIDGSVESSFGRSIFRTCFLISTGRKVVFLIKRTDTLILCLCLAIDGFSTFTPDAVWVIYGGEGANSIPPFAMLYPKVRAQISTGNNRSQYVTWDGSTNINSTGNPAQPLNYVALKFRGAS